MRRFAFAMVVLAGAASSPLLAQGVPANPAIDMDGYLRLTREAAAHRENRRVSEAEFARMAQEPGTIVLDARSRDRYEMTHIEGAVSLPFTDFTVDSLARAIPEKGTRILIYCNNNFSGAEAPFPTKLPPASLNLSTYVALYTYGYRNVFELGPLIEAGASRLPLVAGKGRSAM